MLADISVSFVTGRPFQADLLPNVVSALKPLGFTITGDYAYHRSPAESFSGERFEAGDLDAISVDDPRALKDLAGLDMAAIQSPITYVGLRWQTAAGEFSGSLSLRVFDDDTTAIDLTMPEASNRSRVSAATWRAVADTLYQVCRPLYGAVLVEDEVPGPCDIGGESELSLMASWIYLGPRLAQAARTGVDKLRPLNEEQVLEDGGLFLASSDEPALSHSRKEQRLYEMINELLRTF